MPQNLKKRGYAAKALGCLGIAALFGLLLTVVLWQGLSSWDPEATPWDHLPPDTLWAVHAHDLGTLSKTAFRDKGVRAMIETIHRNQPPGVLESWRSMLPINAVKFDDYLGFLHRVVAPSVVLAGASARDPKAIFTIIHPPAWMRFLLTWSGEKLDDIAETKDSPDEPGLFFAERDGWLITAQQREAVREVLDNWETKTMPLGPGSGRIDAHAFFVARSRAEAKEVPAAAPPPALAPPPSHFTLGDPFAAAGAFVPPPAAPAAPPDNPAVRLLVVPDQGGWNIHCHGALGGVSGGVFGELFKELADDGEGDSLTRLVARELGERIPALSPPVGQNLAVLARLADDVRRDVQGEIDVATRDRDSAVAHPVRALGARFVGEAWAGTAGSGWVFRAAAPAFERGERAFPVLPVLSVGWTLRDGVGVGEAAAAFDGALGDWVEAVRSPEGGGIFQALRSSVVHMRDGGRAGEVLVPEIALNGARPVWKFTEAAPGMGWVATDPAGLPEGDDGEGAALGELKEPGGGRVLVAGGWAFDERFVGGVVDLLSDRLEMLPVGWRDGVRGIVGDPEAALLIAGGAMRHFPKGAFAASLDWRGGEGVAAVRIAPGR